MSDEKPIGARDADGRRAGACPPAAPVLHTSNDASGADWRLVAELRRLWTEHRAAMHAALQYEAFLSRWQVALLARMRMGFDYHRAAADRLADELRRVGGWEDGW